jgi:3-methyl-2-oxobutanoate hydroxymethyltransferase
VGRTATEAAELLADAAALEKAGSVMLLIEAVPGEVSQRIVERAGVPVIGCGAGPACHGQIVVLQDLLGLSHWQPSFASPLAALGPQLVQIARQWIGKVESADLGEHPYHMAEGELGKWR